MTTTSHKKRSRVPRALWVGGLVLALGAAALWRGGASSLFWSVAAPVLHMRDALGDSENARLRAQLASTTLALDERALLYKENLDLKNRLGRTLHRRSILAGVLEAPPAAPYDTLVIDAGASDGIAKGDVVAAGGTAIGALTDVYTNTARVSLLSAPGEVHQAFILSGGINIPVSFAGQGAGSIAGEVPAGTRVVVGDPITMPGVFGGFMGVISRVEAKNGESFKTIYLHLPVNLFELRFIEIWTPLEAQKTQQ